MSIGESLRLMEMKQNLAGLEENMRGAEGTEYDYLQECWEKLTEQIEDLEEQIAEEEAE